MDAIFPPQNILGLEISRGKVPSTAVTKAIVLPMARSQIFRSSYQQINLSLKNLRLLIPHNRENVRSLLQIN
jgi:hypothetical protein